MGLVSHAFSRATAVWVAAGHFDLALSGYGTAVSRSREYREVEVKLTYVKPVDLFMPARMVETASVSREFSSSGVPKRPTENGIKCIVS